MLAAPVGGRPATAESAGMIASPGDSDGIGAQASWKFDILCCGDKTVKITPSRINTLLTIGENLNIEFKCAGDGPKADTFESVYGRTT